LKQIHNSFSWYPRPTWHWPNHDEKLVQVNDWVRDADIAFKYVKRFDIAVQAGGACGVWPVYLSNHFKRVITFEPVKANAECLKKNIEGFANIKFFPAALSDTIGTASMAVDAAEKNNCGAFHISGQGQNTPTVTIDRLNLKACSLIALDVEGFEGKALKGAAKTIEKFSPVIMVEEKPLPHLKNGEHLEARQYLESIGYRAVDAIHRDVVFIRD